MRSNSSFLTLVASFCLSAIAYSAAQPIDVPVQVLEFDEMVIEPSYDVIEFDEMVIKASEERDILDDPAAWCFIHPEDPACREVIAGEDMGGDDSDDEDGC